VNARSADSMVFLLRNNVLTSSGPKSHSTGNNDPLSTPWREVISLAGVSKVILQSRSCRNLRFRDRKSEVDVGTAVRMMLRPVSRLADGNCVDLPNSIAACQVLGRRK
jgi:hypothetical protein